VQFNNEEESILSHLHLNIYFTNLYNITYPLVKLLFNIVQEK